jgi:hypothetical protein
MGSVWERDESYNQSDWGLVDYDPKLTENDAARSQWLNGLGGCLNQDEGGLGVAYQ